MAIREVYPNIYQIEIDLPDTPLKIVNSYFIRGKERNLLVDTAFRAQICIDGFEAAMKELDFTMDNTDLFITHAHSDHCGLSGTLSRETNQVYCGEYTKLELIGDGDDWGNYLEMAVESGLPRMESESHPGYLYATEPVKNITVVKDGDVIQVGDYELVCVETSGHAPDHFCLFMPKEKILFAGDHILAVITPNNTLWERPWGIKRDLLGEYLSNLEKVRPLEPKVVFPGHRVIIEDCATRVDELIEHHRVRLNAVIEILTEQSPQNGAEVASKMQWRIRARNWDEFPNAQKLFATGEAMSHLTHLMFKGDVTADFVDGVVQYSIAK